MRRSVFTHHFSSFDVPNGDKARFVSRNQRFELVVVKREHDIALVRSLYFLVCFELPGVYFAGTQQDAVREATENDGGESVFGPVAQFVN